MSTKQLHKEWRKKFRQGVFERDEFKCKICGDNGKLDAHHITDRHELPNGGYTLSNGISLCEGCHIYAEKVDISKCLYKMINSSYDRAYDDSKNLTQE